MCPGQFSPQCGENRVPFLSILTSQPPGLIATTARIVKSQFGRLGDSHGTKDEQDYRQICFSLFSFPNNQ